MTALVTRRRAGDQAARVPATMKALLSLLILLCLAWGAAGGWVADEHSSAADSVVATGEPLSLDARQMYESIADADVTITATFLASSRPSLAPLRRYAGDISAASADLARLRMAAGDQRLSAALAALIAGLPRYTGYVADAQSQFALGFPLTGGSFLQVASEQAHLVLLPAAKTVFADENAALAAASGRATGLPELIGLLALALLTAIVLFRVQRWLARRTHRVLSPGLVLASVLLIASSAWLAIAFGAARADLDRGIGQGSQPAQDLAQASIGVQQIRGDAVLNVISRSGDTSFQEDFRTTSAQVGPGPGTLLTTARDSSAAGSAAALVAAAGREASAWYAANADIYRLGTAANYAAERNMIIGTGAGSSAAGYDALERDITQAISGDEATFAPAAAAGASVLDPLEAIVIAATVMMAAGCVWSFTRRLAEYR